MKIICLGDSITAPFTLSPDRMWVSLLDRETGDEWINAGICGDTTGGMLVRLHADVFPARPDAVFLMGGGNDMLLTGSFEQPKLNMMALVHECVARGIRPVLGIAPVITGVPEPWRPVTRWEEAPAVSEAYAAWLRVFARTFGLRAVDFAAAFEAHAGERLYQPDGLHPNAAGNRLMADTVLQSPYFRYR